MMRVKVLWFGRSTRSPYEAEVETYRRRVQQRWPAEDLVLKPTRGGRSDDPSRALALEAGAARSHLAQGWQLVALGETGSAMDSVAFARFLEGIETAGSPGVVFVLGSDLGLDPDLRRDAHTVLSLGPLTLPHLVARLVLWEQLFRATSILGGGAYHRP